MSLMIKGALAFALGAAFVAVGCHGDDDSSGTGAGGAGGSGSSDAIAACEASVDAVYAACNAEQPGAPRLCIYEKYRPFCKTGRTDVVKAVFDCLKPSGCQTPSDPSESMDCVNNVARTMATADDHALVAATCGCGDSSPDCATKDLDSTFVDVMLLAKADEQALTACVTQSCDTTACIQASPLEPANECPGL